MSTPGAQTAISKCHLGGFSRRSTYLGVHGTEAGFIESLLEHEEDDAFEDIFRVNADIVELRYEPIKLFYCQLVKNAAR